MRAHIRMQSSTDFGRVWENLAELGRTWQKLIKSAEFSRIQLSIDFTGTFILAEFGRIWQNSIELVKLGRTLLSSVSPRHSYCNWASPVTEIDLTIYIKSFTD